MRGAAAILFINPLDRKVLMVKTNYKQHWDLPGGMIEPGETPRQAAERECKEELGIVTTAGILLASQTILMPDGDLLATWIFKGGQMNIFNIQVDGVEVVRAKWLNMHERAKYTQTAPIFATRLEAAIATWYGGSVRYLDNERTI